MKRVVALCGVAALMLFASSAPVAAVDVATVVQADQLIAKDDVGDDPVSELAFMIAELEAFDPTIDTSTLTYTKIDVNGLGSFEEVTGTDWLAIEFSDFGITDPLAFMVKFGNADVDHYLYFNLDSLDWGVVDLSEVVAGSGNITIESISHSSAVTGETVEVQEPGSLLLMGCGLVFLARRLRRRVAH